MGAAPPRRLGLDAGLSNATGSSLPRIILGPEGIRAPAANAGLTSNRDGVVAPTDYFGPGGDLWEPHPRGDWALMLI